MDVDAISSSYNLSFSLGVWVSDDGMVQDVVTGSPAFDAGVAPGMRLISIANRKWTIEATQDAITSAEHNAAPIELQIRLNKDTFTFRVPYHHGLRYPHLLRDPSFPDSLSKILSPITPIVASGVPTVYPEGSLGETR
jgi:predicted metalloprotease with PDZ domain